MERPVMNPQFMEGAPQPPSPRFRILRLAVRMLYRAAMLPLVADVRFWRRGPRLKVEDAPLWQRLLSGLVYRLLFLPVLIFLVLAALVWLGTHPLPVAATCDPLTFGAYYDPVSFTSAGGTRIEGWLVPMLDAKNVLAQREKVLKAKYPAVVLVHDHGNNRSQMLPLVQPLHDAGYVVLIIGMRGSINGTTGTTFGLREAADVNAAVEMLRRRQGVDPARIAVVGIGTGANAALLAASQDARITALVLDHPFVDVNEMICRELSPRQPWLAWSRPLSKWIFEVAYRVDADDLDFSRCKAAVKTRPILMFDSSLYGNSAFRSRGIAQTRDFLGKYLKPGKPTDLATTGRN